MRRSHLIFSTIGTLAASSALAQVVNSPTTQASGPLALTAAEMASAIPMKLTLPGPLNGGAMVKLANGADGEIGAVAGTAPTAGAPGEALSPIVVQSPQELKAAVATAKRKAVTPDYTPVPMGGTSYPGPNDTYEYGPKYRTYPISTVGKLFFKIGSSNYVCSGTVIGTNIIWTAGHCVADGGASTFYSNWVFCPSYDASQGGPNPALGCWNATSASTTTAWYGSRQFGRDYAVVYLASSGSKLSGNVSAYTGTIGYGWNWPRDQHYSHYGYPAESPYSGGKMITTIAEHRYDDTSSTPSTMSWGSAQTGGSSGSGVLRSFSYSGAMLVSNVSYGYDSLPGELYGPYYDTTTCNNMKSFGVYTGTC